MKKYHLCTIAALLWATVSGAQDFTLGADVSWETEMEAAGYTFANVAGEARECTALMKELGMNAVRLRVWVNPAAGYCNAADVAEKAQRAQALGMDVMVDFHYSDGWADPGKQNIPAAWAAHSYEEMLDDVRTHTAGVLAELKGRGVNVRWVQVGNETSNGLLWPMGRADSAPARYAGFVDAGYGAVKSVFPDALVIVHLDNGFDNGLYSWNLGLLQQYGARFDMVGMSLYPYAAVEWHGLADTTEAIDRCMANIEWVRNTYGVPVMIVETGMKVGRPDEGKDVLAYLLQKARAQEGCRGVMYWEPEAPSGYNGGYDMGAFVADVRKVCRPTAIMEAFTEHSRTAALPPASLHPAVCSAFLVDGRLAPAGWRGLLIAADGRKLYVK